jgi:hypothetical protein
MAAVARCGGVPAGGRCGRPDGARVQTVGRPHCGLDPRVRSAPKCRNGQTLYSPSCPKHDDVHELAGLPRRLRRVVIAAAVLVATTTADAGVICRWTDDAGRTQVAQAAPDKYKKRAICTDTQKYELSPEQEQAAQQRTAQEQAGARAEVTKPVVPPAPSASSAPRPASAAPQPRAKRPVEVVTDATDCATWWRLYDESAACFGPFRTTRGAIKVEAFDACNVVASPEIKCGPRRN